APARTMYATARVRGRAARALECREVGLPLEAARRTIEPLGIEPAATRPRESLDQHVLALEQAVRIATRASGMAGVKTARSVRGLAHAHVARQAAVEERRERPRGQRRLGDERGHLSARV